MSESYKIFEEYKSMVLKSASLWKDMATGEHFLKLRYGAEDKKGIYEIVFPKVKMNIPRYAPLFSREKYNIFNENMYISINDCNHLIMPDENSEKYCINVVEEKVREMTLKDIEKELGCKIKIVDEG